MTNLNDKDFFVNRNTIASGYFRDLIEWGLTSVEITKALGCTSEEFIMLLNAKEITEREAPLFNKLIRKLWASRYLEVNK